jgi:DNA invertase Pin-like site-specific DNA recombinase
MPLCAYVLHKSKGALGQFLKLVEQGCIAKGSTLLVENMDRLSREQVLDALG